MKKLLLILLVFSFCNYISSAQQTSSTPANKVEIDTPKKPAKPPETSQEFYEAARWIHWNDSNTVEAIKLLDKAISMQSDFSDAFWLRGNLKKQMGNCKSAIEDYDIVIQQVPDAVNTYQYRAECRIALNDLRGALLDLDMSVSLLAAQGKIQYNAFVKRGKLKYLLKDYNGAIEDFTSAARMNVSLGARVFRAFSYLKKGDPEASIADLTALANYLFESGKEARQAYPDQYKEKTDYPPLENPLATLQKKPGNPNVESNVYIESRGGVSVGCKSCPETKFAEFEDKLNPDNWFFMADKVIFDPGTDFDLEAVVNFFLGDLLEKKGDTAGAIKAFTEAIIRKRYDDGAIRFRRGRLLLRTREFEPAVKDFSWVIADSRANSAAYLERGIAIFMLGHDELAGVDFDKFLKLNPSPEAKEYLAKRKAEAQKLRDELKQTQPATK